MATWYFENVEPWPLSAHDSHRPRPELEAQLLSEGHTVRWWCQNGPGTGLPRLEEVPDLILVWGPTVEDDNYWRNRNNVLEVVTLPGAWEK